MSSINIILGQLSDKQGVSVFDAIDVRLRRRVILKVQEPTESFQAIERFRREAIALSLIDHPNVVSLYEYTEAEPRSMSLERIKADNIAEHVAKRGGLPVETVCRMVEDVAAALDCSHARGVLHRDVRPENILVPAKGPARLIDFGLAKIIGEPHITYMGQVLRDHSFASPEQMRGEAYLDARTDVYSLAAVAYYALTGQEPEDGYVPARSYIADLPAEIDAILESGVAKNAVHRFHTAGQFAAALRVALESCRGKFRPRSWFNPRASWLTAVLCALICGLAIWLAYAQSTPASAKRASSASRSISVAQLPRHSYSSSHRSH